MEFLYRIAENRILEAIDAGHFDNLRGKGRPLVLEDDSHIPPELEMRKEIVRLQDLVASLPDEAEKLKQMRRLNFLIMKLGITRKVSPLLEEHELYAPKVLERLESRK